MHENLFLGETSPNIEQLEKDFSDVVLDAVKNDPDNFLEMNKV